MRLSILLTAVLCTCLHAQNPAPDALAAAGPDAARFAEDPASDRLIAAAGRMKTDERIAMYEKLAGYKPDNLHYQNLLAATFIQKMRETTDFGYIDRASRIVNNVLSLEPANYEALRLRSEIGLERHQFAEVAEWSREMTRIASDDAWNWGTLGDALMEMGEYDRAAEAYQKMVTLKPNQSSYNRASYYRFVLGDAQGAIAIMQQAIAAGSPSPENTAWCWVDLGNLYFKTGRLDDAARAYAAALGTFAGYYPAYAGLGRVQAAEGRYEQAIESYKRAQAAVPMPEYAAALADLYDRTGNKVEAQRQLEMVDVVDKMARANNEKTNRNLAMVFADQGRNLERALELAQAELKVRGDVYTYDALAWTLYKNGKYQEAESAAAKALAFGTPEPGFYYHAGMIANALGNKVDARKYLERALALNPRFDLRQAALAEAALRDARTL
jgi:tetratricopeptide (TPR) repeat protein